MHPPPSTPTPRRFLLPKRGTQTSSQTPTSAAAAPTGTPRFQSTPRFAGGPGSSSVVRPLGRRELSQEIEDVDEPEGEGPGEGDEKVVSSSFDDEERVVSSSASDEERILSSSAVDEEAITGARQKARLGDDILEADDEGTQRVVLGSESPELRRAKRRRVSLDEAMVSSSSIEELPATLSDENENDGGGQNALRIFSDSEGEDIDLTERDATVLQQPTFRAAPRFKPTEGDVAAAQGLLPAAFSPQRRGAKYLPSGLASELQGWLSDVKRWDEDGGGPAGKTGQERFQILVEEVRKDGERMYLVQGRVVEAAVDEQARSGRFILAGEGRLTGLGRKGQEVGNGVVVDVEGPVWDVELDGVTWLVCCEWWVG
ncbi:hypothetical protein NLU13_7401 [Sarocladium strictum]|uniref:Uncharacterized protein n=1 Tax=Sarocladium strictum TaxID=5046 RepID=A0AA39GCQ5_SARSR|nr:hypothetical protein NLU13_7401 [Sarocladium strictum]